MARLADVQYVQYGVDGTAARKVEHQAVENEAVMPQYKRRKAEHKVIAVDPVALAGIVLSAIVVIAMVFGLVQYHQSMRLSRQMSAYVTQLEQENAQLEATYKAGYDLDEVMDIALEAGMVPVENMQRVRVEAQLPQQEEQTRMSFWDSLTTFLTGIFA